ncbi:MAG TPA: transketolase [Spirochaetia bacterium]
MDNPFSLPAAELAERARRVRRRVILMNSRAGQGHTGADLSETDILVSLYFNVLRYAPDRPDDPGRDRFILSKGHGVGGLYCTLAELGVLPERALETYLQYDSALPGHPVRQKTPFVELNTGALGHGLSVGVGLALAAKKSGAGYRVYVLLGDGELDEGSVWEAAMSAAHFRLDNLVAIVDRNTLQLADRTERIMALEPLDAKWQAFGFAVHRAEGNDPASICACLRGLDHGGGRPSVVIARTTKGKGVSFIEDRPPWHHKVPVGDEIERAVKELG